MSVEERIISILNDNGVTITKSEDDKITLDSIEFVSVIVGIEEEFNIEIPDENLRIDKLTTLKQYCDLINVLLQKQ